MFAEESTSVRDDAHSIDLVLATVGRTDEVRRFLRTVESQSWSALRVIIVDQNGDDRLAPVIAEHSSQLSLLHVRSEPGLSRARNVGLRLVDADIVAFPDDDCWYPPGLLARVSGVLAANPAWDGISVRSTDGAGRPSNMRWDRRGGPIGRFNVWKRAISYSVFLRRPVVRAVGEFDERLGAGAGTRWGSSEESDYFLRTLEAGFTLFYEPRLDVFHGQADDATGGAWHRAYSYGLGNGLVLRRHDFPWWFALWRSAQLLVASGLFLLRVQPSRSRFYAAMAWGRVRGWLSSTGPR